MDEGGWGHIQSSVTYYVQLAGEYGILRKERKRERERRRNRNRFWL